MPLYLVETVSMFRMRYAVECESAQEANLLISNHLSDDEIKEFSQHHISEPVSSVREIQSQDEFVELFDADNDYLAEWSVDQKLRCINIFNNEG